MDLSQEDRNNLEDILKMTPETLELFLKNVQNYYMEPGDKQKQYEIFVKILIELHKSKSEELFVSYLSQTYRNQNYDKQIKLITNYISENRDMFSGIGDRFIDLKWRLNTKIASRAVNQISNFEPKVTIEVCKSKQNAVNHKKIFIHSSPSVLNHVIQKLEQALIDSKNVIRKEH
ncbi:unnamed protein product [Chironomus riparius]|uniref:COMM domain-containing protein n=1 Tax=Chironomus riparius TaxID=315576 RepID=A0A9N9RZY7_9DIPT|nr:unnamed protein product [Chironomus riparius]